MKKNISINISGIIFHIEEEGYDTLKKYLDSINKYFSSFEDSSEILADIESRIAEIFLSKLNEEKQVITMDDVNALIATMGSVSDFRAAEEQEQPEKPFEATSGNTGTNYQSSSSSSSSTYTPPKQLFRDQKRKILGGVCSGLGNYLNVDAMWIRLIFALLFFAYGLTFFVYIVMWIIVPGSFDLDEPIVEKKMFRNPENKVIAGVSSGVAAYLGIDVVGMRVIFVLLTILGGFGLFIYIVLWLILPEARSLTDKMQMQGEPVTLSNIESTLKKSQVERNQEESVLTKIVLFPFRLIGMVLSALAKVLGPLVEVVRVVIGVFVSFIGLCLLFSIIVTGGILFGLFSSAAFSLPWMTEFSDTTIPLDAFMRAFPGWTAIASFFVTVIPSVFIILLGISIIAKRLVFNAAVGWSLFVLFFINIGILAVGIPKIVMSFKQDADYVVENTYVVKGKRALLRMNDAGMEEYHAVTLDLQGYDEPNFKLVQKFEAQGSSRRQAVANAQMVSYNVEFADSVFRFDSNLEFKDDAIFRAQRLNMKLYIPYDFPFTMDEDMSRFIEQYVDSRYMEDETWVIRRDEGLTCISCPKEENRYSDMSDFDEIEIKGKFDLRVINGESYSVKVNGSDRAKSRYRIVRQGSTLRIDFDGDDSDKNFRNLNVDEVEVIVSLPNIERIEAVGVGEIRVDNGTAHDVEFDLRGPIKLRGEVHANSVDINLSGTAEADLEGTTNHLNARVELASRLRAYDLQATHAFVETSGASNARVYVTDDLEIKQGVASKVEHRGGAHVIKLD